MTARCTAPPVFVGGVPRSGTHALGNLIGEHSHYAMIPRELAFHTATGEGSLPDLLAGSCSVEYFVERMRTHWWKRRVRWDENVTRGLHKFMAEDQLHQALEQFVARYEFHPFAAVRSLMHDLLDPIALAAGKRGWVEMDPTNVLVAPMLYRIFPDMRLISIVRDGRDVASSLRRLPWGTTNIASGVWFWQRTMVQADRATRAVPPRQMLTMSLEALVTADREASYKRLLDFLVLDDEPQIRGFFETRVSASAAHVGRWRTELSRPGRLAISTMYSAALACLAVSGVAGRPPLRSLFTASPTTSAPREGTGRLVDPWSDGTARDA